MKNTTFRFLTIAVMIMTLFIEGCKNNGIDLPTTPLKAGELQATISPFGPFYATDCQVTDGGVANTYFVAASVKDQNNNDSLVIHILIPKKTPPYTIDVQNDDVAVMDYCITTATACITYQSKKGIGSASVKITDATASNVQGTFSGTLPLESGTGSVTISSGEFNASF